MTDRLQDLELQIQAYKKLDDGGGLLSNGLNVPNLKIKPANKTGTKFAFTC